MTFLLYDVRGEAGDFELLIGGDVTGDHYASPFHEALEAARLSMQPLELAVNFRAMGDGTWTSVKGRVTVRNRRVVEAKIAGRYRAPE